MKQAKILLSKFSFYYMKKSLSQKTVTNSICGKELQCIFQGDNPVPAPYLLRIYSAKRYLYTE